jgi:HEAT repeat protein
MAIRVVCLWASWLAFAMPMAGAENVADLIKRLENGPKAVRLESLKELREMKGPEALKAIPAATRLVEDEDPEIREAAIGTLAPIAYRNKQPCPLAIIKALFDADPEVRSTATTYVGIDFQKYPEEARRLLLRALEHDDTDVRANVSGALARVWGKDKEVIAALKKATKDKKLIVRNNAYAALWPLIGDLDFVLPHWLEASDALGLVPQEDELRTEEEKRERCTACLIGIGSAVKLVELTAERPAELAAALLKLLTHPSPVIRRSAARSLGAMNLDGKEPRIDAKDFPPDIKLPQVDHQKVKGVLVDLKVAAEVRKLLNDPDASVRASAATALKRLTSE